VPAPFITNIVIVEDIPATLLPTNGASAHQERTVRRVSSADWVDMTHWNASAVGATLKISNNQQCRLHSAYGDFIFTPKSQKAFWNGQVIMMGYAPQWSNKRPYLHRMDLESTVMPLLRHCPSISNPAKILVIDPGHGGDQPGSRTVVGNRAEKDLTLDWALRTRALLTNRGWTVYLTRTNNSDVSLSNRVAFADNLHASLFVSLHFNSIKDAGYAGLETYCMTPAGMASNMTRGSETLDVQPNNAFDEDNICWAARLHGSLIRHVKPEDRGVRRARFMAVLRTQKCPAVLIEGGYLSNKKEAEKIITPAYRQQLAQALAKAFTNP
jgi:N-acetylmuramoyl-L-alanine amidase